MKNIYFSSLLSIATIGTIDCQATSPMKVDSDTSMNVEDAIEVDFISKA